MTFIAGLVLVAWLAVLPMGFVVLAVTGWPRDRSGAVVQAIAGLGFGLNTLVMALGTNPAMPEPGRVGVALILLLHLYGLVALGIRLWRDRKLRHIRSTLESLAVLGIGTAFLLVLYGFSYI